MHRRLCHLQLCKRRQHIAPADVWRDDQLQDSEPEQLDAVILGLARCARRAEVPLLAYHLVQRAATIRRPAERVFLRALHRGFSELQSNAMHVQGRGEEQSDNLLSRLSRTPTATSLAQKRIADGMCTVLGAEFTFAR